MSDWLPLVGWVALCVAIPVLWGVIVNAVFDAYSASSGSAGEAAPPEYHI